MNELFNSLKEEKRRKIIKSSIYAFSMNTYKSTKTDDIAMMAGIAKGSLFAYFKNKRCLYLYTYKSALKMLINHFIKAYDAEETDYFEIYRKSIHIKLNLLETYPRIYDFVIKASLEEDPLVKEDISKITKKYSQHTLDQLFENVDMDKFKENIDISKLSKMIEWCAEGIRNEAFSKGLPLTSIENDAYELLDFFKQLTYK